MLAIIWFVIDVIDLIDMIDCCLYHFEIIFTVRVYAFDRIQYDQPIMFN